MISDFGRIEKSSNRQNCFEIQENILTCEFSTYSLHHYTCRHAEMNLKSTTTNRFKSLFWLTNSLWNLGLEGWGGGGGGGVHGYSWPGLTANGTGALSTMVDN